MGVAVFLSQVSKGTRVVCVVDTDPFPVGSASFFAESTSDLFSVTLLLTRCGCSGADGQEQEPVLQRCPGAGGHPGRGAETAAQAHTRAAGHRGDGEEGQDSQQGEAHRRPHVRGGGRRHHPGAAQGAGPSREEDCRHLFNRSQR